MREVDTADHRGPGRPWHGAGISKGVFSFRREVEYVICLLERSVWKKYRQWLMVQGGVRAGVVNKDGVEVMEP